jgi:hypothetical protein
MTTKCLASLRQGRSIYKKTKKRDLVFSLYIVDYQKLLIQIQEMIANVFIL